MIIIANLPAVKLLVKPDMRQVHALSEFCQLVAGYMMVNTLTRTFM